MITELNKIIPISFLVTDAYGVPQTGLTSTVTIKRMDTGYFYTGSGWQTNEIALNMTHSFKGLYIYNFTPAISTTYVIRCSETTTKTEGGAIFTISDKLENCDVKISTRLATSGYVAPNNSMLDIINDNVIDLDAQILTRSTNQGVWEHTDKQLSPSNTQGIGSCSITINTTNVTSIEIYDSNRVAKYELIPSANVGTIKLNPGTYYFIALKDGHFTKQVEITVPSASSYSVDITLSPITNTEDLNIKFREVNAKTVYKDDTIRIILEAFSTNGKEFTISNATSKESTNTLTTTVSGNKIYVTFHPTTAATFIIDTDVVIGSEIYTVKTTKKVI